MAICSVIIPVYNDERHIGQAVSSALGQTWPDVEVVVVNDGSTDGTKAVLESFMDRILYVEQPNKGSSAARNSAIEASSGEYVALLDSDDWFHPSRLSQLIQVLESDPEPGFVTSDAWIVRGNDATSEKYYRDLVPSDSKFRTTNQDVWISQVNFVFTACVVRKELFDRFGHFDEGLSFAEDWDVWTRFILGGARVALVDEPLSYYRIRSGSLTRQTPRMLDGVCQILARNLDRAPARAKSAVEARMQFAAGALAAAEGRALDARAPFLRAARSRALPLNRRVQALGAALVPGLAMRRFSDSARTKK